MTQIFRKDPCLCGSGKKYKRCCGENSNPTQPLVNEIQNALSVSGHKELLLSLASIAVLPENHRQEFRFLHLALMLLESAASTSPHQTHKLETTISICKRYDSMYGSIWPMQEFDFKNIPYLSWFNVRGRGFKMLSGTLAEPELYYQETLHRAFPLDPIMQSQFGFGFPTFLALFIQRGHDFLLETGLSKFDDASAGDWSQHISFGQSELAKSIRDGFERHYVFNRFDLNSEQLKLLEFLSQPPSGYSSDMNALMSGQSSIHVYPVVRLDNQFVIPFPQLLLPAICNRVWHVLGTRRDAVESYEVSSRNRLIDLLVKRFGIEAIIPISADIQNRLADVFVLFDQKVLCFQISVGSDGLQPATERAALAQKVWDEHREQGGLTLNGTYRSVTLPDLRDLEIIHLVILAIQSDDAPIMMPMEETDAIFVVMSFKELEYIFSHLDSELDFIKFLRAKERLNRTGAFIMGGDNLDQYSLYAESGTLLRTYKQQKITGVMVDPLSFSSKHLEDLKKFRQKHRIYGKEQRFLRNHYPGAWKGIDKDANYFFAFDFENVTATLQATFPGDDESLFRAWHVSLEALTYHLGTRRTDIEKRLLDIMPDVRELRITVHCIAMDAPATFEGRVDSGKVFVKIDVSPVIASIFMSGNNEGERLLVNGLLKCVGLITEDETDTLYLAPSITRRTQLFPHRIPHKSFGERTEAIKIYKADRRLVEAFEATALSAEGTSPGTWTDKDEIMKVLSLVHRAIHQEFQTRIRDIAYEELVQLSYRQLEAAYIESEQAKMQLAICAHTAEFVDIEKEYLETSQKAVELSFAIRLILETALQISSESKKHITEEKYTELLAFAGRLVELDFEGDMICMFVPTKLNLVSLELNNHGVLQSVGGKDMANPAGGHMFKTHKSKLSSPHEANRESSSNPFPKDDFLQSFNEPFKKVYGYSLSDRIDVAAALLRIFDEQDSPILDENMEWIIDTLCAGSNKAPDMVRSILNDLTLTKEHLSELKTISPSTKYWRGARILNRPIIQLGENILVTRMVLDLSMQIFIRRLAAGRFVPEVKDATPLTNEVGRWRNVAGEHFRMSIVELFRAHGFEAFPEVESLNSVAIPREGISGVDIVAIDKRHRLILVVECKDIEMSKNPKDLKNEVFNFFLNDKEPSYVKRTKNKWQWISDNRNHLFAQYNLNVSEDWYIEPLLVTSDYLWSQLLVETDLSIRSEQELSDWLLER